MTGLSKEKYRNMTFIRGQNHEGLLNALLSVRHGVHEFLICYFYLCAGQFGLYCNFDTMAE